MPLISSRYRHCCPQSRGFPSQRLPFLWLTRVSTTACSFRRRCSSHSTSWSFSSNHWKHTSPELGWKCFTKCREQLFFRGCFCCLFFQLKGKPSQKYQDFPGHLRGTATHNVRLIHLDGHLADCVCGFVEHLKETSTTQSLCTYGTWQLQDQEGGDGKLSAAPILGSEELVSIRWYAQNLSNKLFEL